MWNLITFSTMHLNDPCDGNPENNTSENDRYANVVRLDRYNKQLIYLHEWKAKTYK